MRYKLPPSESYIYWSRRNNEHINNKINSSVSFDGNEL